MKLSKNFLGLGSIIFCLFLAVGCCKENNELIFLNPYAGLSFNQLIAEYPLDGGLDQNEISYLFDNGYQLGRIEAPGTLQIFEDQIGEISIAVPSLGSPTGFQLVTTIPNTGAEFYFKPNVNTIYWAGGGNASLLSELLETGYQLSSNDPTDEYLETVSPASLKVYQPASTDPFFSNGITASHAQQLVEQGWNQVNVTYDGLAPFLFWDKNNPVSNGIYLGFLEPGTPLPGFERGGVFLASACGNPTTCWRWLS